MITGSMIYWITRCDAIHTSAGVFGVIFAVVGVVMTIFTFIAMYESGWNSDTKWLLTATLLIVPIGVICSTAWVFVPTTKEACAILVIPEVANNEAMQDIPVKLVEIAGEWMEELRPDSVKESAGANKDSSP